MLILIWKVPREIHGTPTTATDRGSQTTEKVMNPAAAAAFSLISILFPVS